MARPTAYFGRPSSRIRPTVPNLVDGLTMLLVASSLGRAQRPASTLVATSTDEPATCLPAESWVRPVSWLPPQTSSSTVPSQHPLINSSEVQKWQPPVPGAMRLPAVRAPRHWELPSNGTDEYRLSMSGGRCQLLMSHLGSPGVTVTGFLHGECPAPLASASTPRAVEWKRFVTTGIFNESGRCAFSGFNPSVVRLPANSPLREQVAGAEYLIAVNAVPLWTKYDRRGGNGTADDAYSGGAGAAAKDALAREAAVAANNAGAADVTAAAAATAAGEAGAADAFAAAKDSTDSAASTAYVFHGADCAVEPATTVGLYSGSLQPLLVTPLLQELDLHFGAVPAKEALRPETDTTVVSRLMDLNVVELGGRFIASGQDYTTQWGTNRALITPLRVEVVSVDGCSPRLLVTTQESQERVMTTCRHGGCDPRDQPAEGSSSTNHKNPSFFTEGGARTASLPPPCRAYGGGARWALPPPSTFTSPSVDGLGASC